MPDNTRSRSPYAGYMAAEWTPEEKERIAERNRSVLNYTSNSESAGFPHNYFLQDEDNPSLMMGVELEVSTPEPVKLFTWNTPFPALYAKQDSTISSPEYGRDGFELVSVPADMNHQKTIWANVFRNTKGSRVYRDADTGNGLHIHLDLDTSFEDDEHIQRFCAFLLSGKLKQKSWLVAVSQRTEQSFMRYCRTAHDRDRLNSLTLGQLKDHFNRNGSYSYAASFSRYNTLEVRLFRGIYSYANMLSCFEFTEALVEWTKSATMEEAYNLTGGTSPGRRFHNWVLADTRTSKWRHLKANFRAMQTFFDTESVALVNSEIESLRSGHMGCDEGSVFQTEMGAQYACRMAGNDILSYVPDGDLYRLVWSDNIFSSGDEETNELLSRSLKFNEDNTKVPRLEEVPDNDLDAYSWGEEPTNTGTTG